MTLRPRVTAAGSKWHCKVSESERHLFSHLKIAIPVQITANVTPEHFPVSDSGVRMVEIVLTCLDGL